MSFRLLLVGCIITACGYARAEDGNPLTPNTFQRILTQTLGCRYLISLPEGYSEPDSKRWPLIVYLHGRSPDREAKPSELAGYFDEMRNKANPPAILVTPLCPGSRGWRPELIVALVDELQSLYQVDPNRVYLAGMSMGGYGVWTTLTHYPERFAAGVSLCGGLDDLQRLSAMKNVPIWNIHGAKDDTVPLEESEKAVSALRAAGGYVIHTVEPEMDHMDLIPWHTDPRIYTWLMEQRRGVLPDPSLIPQYDAMRQDASSTTSPVANPIRAHAKLKSFNRPFSSLCSGQYLLYSPKTDQEPDKAWPLLIFLHGSGEVGMDLEVLKKYGPMKMAASGQDYPFYVAAPQCPEGEWGWNPDTIAALADEVCDKYPVDRSRVYLMGLSMGGWGVWRTLSAHPDRFAAAVAVAGMDMPVNPTGMRDVPILTRLGGKDDVVDLVWAKAMVERLVQAGGDALCEVVPDAGHLDMTRFTEEPELINWLMDRRKGEMP